MINGKKIEENENKMKLKQIKLTVAINAIINKAFDTIKQQT